MHEVLLINSPKLGKLILPIVISISNQKPNKYFLFIAYSVKPLETDQVWNLEQDYFIFQGN